MKFRLRVCGKDRGEVEVADDSIIGLLVRGEFDAAARKVAELEGVLKEEAWGCFSIELVVKGGGGQ